MIVPCSGIVLLLSVVRPFRYRFGRALGQTHSLPSLGLSDGTSGLAMCVAVKVWHNSITSYFFRSILKPLSIRKSLMSMHFTPFLSDTAGILLFSSCFRLQSTCSYAPYNTQSSTGLLLLSLRLVFVHSGLLCCTRH